VALALAAASWLRLRGRTGARLGWAALGVAFGPLAWRLGLFPGSTVGLLGYLAVVLVQAVFVALAVGLSALPVKRGRPGPAEPGL
jgi:hypothetical protein